MKQKTIQELLEFSIINLDKPSGITSFGCADKVRKILRDLGVKKTGHTGTLDPGVTGVLPILINRACKLSNYFMKKDKEYVGKMKIHKDISEEKLKSEMEKFLGKIIQKPPKKSRVKRVPRNRIINKFRIVSFDKTSRIVEFHSDVQAGTYIRKLISDLGDKIGGAHMTELRRTRAGIFKEKDSHTLDEIYNAVQAYKSEKEQALKIILIPAEIIKQIITSVQVKEESPKRLLNGKPLMKSDLKNKIPNSDKISVFHKENFIGIYRVVCEKDVVARPEFVRN
ncbi:RNA-guided pseudouridylation complex pseudouridine synthase subunit Cbf5 [Candidatus Pacearchaeota archaeon]|nr:RNA-guided pseudouridylation complex pseudouridine synthase subunit Cbf5 [Candidatus Pacearchaeota archaeon]